MKRIHKYIILLIGIVCSLIFAQFQSHYTFAQSGSGTWFPPVNISKSGGVSTPTLIVDPNGVFHLIWQDEFAGFVYSHGDGQTWSEPQAVEFPFSYEETSIYKFAVDSRERMHALWIDERGYLYYSRSALEDFSNILGWSSVQRMTRSAIYFDIVTDQNSNFHLAYLRGESRRDGIPAGIYYQRFLDGTTNWSDPTVIEQTPYLRTIAPEEANIDIATAFQNDLISVYITWDNPPKRQVYLAQSDDTGLTWKSPFAIGNPTNAFYTPKRVQIEASGTQAMILWKQTEESGADETEQTCIQQYLWTSDGGKSWQEPKILFDEQNGCPEESHLFGTKDGFLLFTILNDQGYLLFWNGSEWSPPQQQNDFSNLTDPETKLFLNLHSMQSTMVDGTLYLIGSDSFDTSDIWSTGSKLEETQSWFPKPSDWTEPEEIVQEFNEIGSTHLLADSTGRIHALWNQATTNDSYPNVEIYYSVWDGTSWSPAGMIFRSPSNRAYLHNTAITSDDVIYLVWDSGNTEGLTLSWADADKAYNQAEWVISDSLPSPHWYATSPDICINKDDHIIITYVLPLNEDRSVYFIQSSDGGNTWDQVNPIVDAASEGWAMVENPHISSCGENMEVIWTTFTLPPDSIPLALHSTISNDGGVTWSAAKEVVEGYVIWSDVLETNDNTIHRIWEENERGVSFLWHQHSLDQGDSWNSPENILTTNASIDAITTFLDPAKQLHLIFATFNTSGNTIIHHWLWDGEKWRVNDSLNLGKGVPILPESLSATITSGGTLGVIYGSDRLDPSSEDISYHIDFSSREIEIPNIDLNIITPTETLEPTQIPTTPTSTPLPQSSPTPTPPLPDVPSIMPGISAWSGPIIGVGIGVVLLSLFVSVGLFVRNRRNR